MSDKIEVRWGDATTQLQKLREPIDFLLLDAKPSEYLDYLKAAEPLLSPGSIIVADNAGNVCEISWFILFFQGFHNVQGTHRSPKSKGSCIPS
jgi:hypothetical protein